jgi:hypothetical protein
LSIKSKPVNGYLSGTRDAQSVPSYESEKWGWVEMNPYRRHMWIPALMLAVLSSGLMAGQAVAGESAPIRQSAVRREPGMKEFDVIILGGTPAGIMAAVAAARAGHTALILERNAHIGGLPANGLGATDITTRGATGGLFLEFVNRIRRHYESAYGKKSPQVEACSDGYHFEPHVAEKIFLDMLDEQSERVTVLLQRQFDSNSENVELTGTRLSAIVVTRRDTGQKERHAGGVFIDATYEGDLGAAAGVPFRVGRESKQEYNEPRAGALYAYYEPRYSGTEPDPDSTGAGDKAVQAYNYRVCLTSEPGNRVAIEKPVAYDRAEYASIIDDIRQNRMTRPPQDKETPWQWNGIGRVVSLTALPNGKTDANDQASAFLSTDLAEENWAWPTATWEWRDRYAQRLRNYILGLIWFIQHDPEVPENIRTQSLNWGLAKDEYTDNGNFPRQPYVREGRRLMGDYLFTAHDALPTDGIAGKNRPPLHADSITASHYHLDSHAAKKREPGRIAREGFFSLKGTSPYTVPYGTIVPQKIDGLLTPVATSATHIGLSTLRMEPCWMALGQAAGVAAGICIENGVQPRAVDTAALQRRLLAAGAVLVYFNDVNPGAPHFESLQYFALRGFFPPAAWQAQLKNRVDADTAQRWLQQSKLGAPEGFVSGKMTRGEFLDALYSKLQARKDR